MNWNPFSKKDDEPELDPLQDLDLSNLKPGYVLDYDLKTWRVTAHNTYDYEGDSTDEWELSCADDVVYLEREEDDGIAWTLTRKLPLTDIEGDVRGHLRENEDPPERVTCRGTEYVADSSDVGQFYKDGQGEGREFIVWSYEDSSGKQILTVEQWGDDEYDASIGEVVEEYQFSSILPSA